jgi:hypothetical protein
VAVRLLAGVSAGALVFGVLLLTAGCQKLFGDYSVAGSSITSVCEPNTVQCYSNTLQRCSADGLVLKNEHPCASAVLCDAERGVCTPPTCAAGERRCNGAELQGCNSDRNGWLRLASCSSAAHCSADAGLCTEQPCEAGKTQCNGPIFQACNDTRTGWSDVGAPCASAALCDSLAGCASSTCSAGNVRCQGGELQSCNDALNGWVTTKTCDSPALCDSDAKTCRPAGCTTPGAFRCDALGALERCADDLTAWLPVQPCESAAHCDALNGRCNTAPCTAGAHQCNGADLQVCNGKGWDSIETCESDGLCQQALANDESKCREPACAAGSFQCNGAQPQVCNAALTGYRDNGAPCMTAELCSSDTGTCGEPVCEAGQTRCTGAQPEICNPGRTMFVSHGDECASASLCSFETGTCDDVVCLAGQKRCNPANPTQLQICNEQLDGWDDCDTCATAQLCSASIGSAACGASACVEPTCAIGDRWCGGTDNRTLYQCPASRINTQAVALDTCDSNGLCEATRADAMRTMCIEKTCSLQDRWCGGTGNRTLYKCPPSLINSQAIALDECATNGLCVQAHSTPNAMTCPEPACATPGYSCAGTGSRVLQFCNTERTQLMPCDTCDTAALCTASLTPAPTACNMNSCEAPACAAGEKSCSGTTLQICNASRTGFVALATCGSATLCMNSLTPVNQMTCDQCVADTFQCDDAQPQECSAPANGPAVWEDVGEPCADEADCEPDTGTCEPMGMGGSGG